MIRQFFVMFVAFSVKLCVCVVAVLLEIVNRFPKILNCGFQDTEGFDRLLNNVAMLTTKPTSAISPKTISQVIAFLLSKISYMILSCKANEWNPTHPS